VAPVEREWVDPQSRVPRRSSSSPAATSFPWDYNLGYSFAFITDFVIPASPRLWPVPGVRPHSMKRYDDTMLFPFGAHRHGLETSTERAAIRKLNKIHGHYNISNTDYRHILAGHLVSAIDWINAYGWRTLSKHEERALLRTHIRLGELMGIKDIPQTYDEFKQWLENDIKSAAPGTSSRTIRAHLIPWSCTRPVAS
jgi:mpaB/rubber oxygenase-like protein